MRFALLVLPLSLLSAGCSGEGNLAGNVTFNGKKVVSGSVVVLAADSVPRYGEILEDGTYRVEKVPCGDVKIAVYSPPPEKPGKAGGRALEIDPTKPVKKGEAPPPARVVDPKTWFPLPPDFQDFDNSQLRFNVARGDNSKDLVMTGEVKGRAADASKAQNR